VENGTQKLILVIAELGEWGLAVMHANVVVVVLHMDVVALLLIMIVMDGYIVM
tara:strand:- start:529 stop:687 length:159 start_codon:yes stop_codon:yes gene_type:complete